MKFRDKMKGSHLQRYEFGDFRLDIEERALIPFEGPPVPLTPRIFETLRYLVEHPGRIADKQSLMEAVWPDCIVEENNLAQNISTLRRIFGDKNGTQRYIATVPGRGYRFLPQVKAISNGIPSAEIQYASAEKKPTTHLVTARPKRPAILWLSLALVVGTAAFFFWRDGAPLNRDVPDKSIAVLPFVNLSPDPDNIYFADGIKDEILTRLSKIGSLKVISRTSTQEFAGKSQNVREIAQRLGVAYVLEGSVQKSDGTVRVTVQLIHASSDTHLWAETYDRNLTDMFRVESDIAQHIASALETTLTGSEQRSLAARPTANLEAYREYLQGRYFWNKRTAEGFKEAIIHLNRAVQIDPSYAQACVGLADALLFLGNDGVRGPKEAIEKVRALLTTALELDDTLGDAHASLGLLAMNNDWDWARAEKEFKRAIELNPNYATAHQWYGEFLAYMGRFDEAIAESKRAHELDPLSLIIGTDVAKVHALARRYDKAIPLFQAVLKMDSEFSEAHGLLAFTYVMGGELEEAVHEIHKVKNIETNPNYLSWFAYIHGIAGNKEEARAAVRRLEKLSSQTYISPFWMATAWTGIGDKDEVFRWFERVFAEHAPSGAVSLKVNPIFDPLRSDPRYADLLQRAHLAD